MTSPDSGPRVLVTGAASGLGDALASAYERRGARVLRCDVAYPTTTSSGQAGGPGPLHLDVRSDQDWAAAVDLVTRSWAGLDVLVNNAGVAGGGRVEVSGLDEWEWITEINLFGVVRGTRAFVPMMKAAGGGQIVNVASLAGLVHPAGMGSYNAVKAAVVAFTETLSHELAADHISAHVVCPSYFRTNLLSSMRGRDTGLAAAVGHLVETAPLGAEEMAALVLAGLDAGEEVIVPDEAARAAYTLKRTDRATYDAMMRAQAAKLPPVTDVPTGSAPEAGGEDG